MKKKDDSHLSPTPAILHSHLLSTAEQDEQPAHDATMTLQPEDMAISQAWLEELAPAMTTERTARVWR